MPLGGSEAPLELRGQWGPHAPRGPQEPPEYRALFPSASGAWWGRSTGKPNKRPEQPDLRAEQPSDSRHMPGEPRHSRADWRDRRGVRTQRDIPLLRPQGRWNQLLRLLQGPPLRNCRTRGSYSRPGFGGRLVGLQPQIQQEAAQRCQPNSDQGRGPHGQQRGQSVHGVPLHHEDQRLQLSRQRKRADQRAHEHDHDLQRSSSPQFAGGPTLFPVKAILPQLNRDCNPFLATRQK